MKLKILIIYLYIEYMIEEIWKINIQIEYVLEYFFKLNFDKLIVF